jgi:ABC-type cobalamin transport system ATPase subunit
MSFWRDLLGDMRRLMLMDDKLARMEGKLDGVEAQVVNHEGRLIQIETAMFGPVPPDRLRLPRR